MPSSGMLRLVALVRTDVSEERSASIIRVTRIGELGTTLAFGGDIFLRNLCSYMNHTSYHPRRRYSSVNNKFFGLHRSRRLIATVPVVNH
jgi:hypothetical protein